MKLVIHNMKSEYWSMNERPDGKIILVFCDVKMIFDTKEQALIRLVSELDIALMTIIHDDDDDRGVDCSNMM